jgi:hypothetical protein
MQLYCSPSIDIRRSCLLEHKIEMYGDQANLHGSRNGTDYLFPKLAHGRERQERFRRVKSDNNLQLSVFIGCHQPN